MKQKITIDKEAFDLLRREAMDGNFNPDSYKKVDEDCYEIEVIGKVLRILDQAKIKYGVNTYSAVLKKFVLIKKVKEDNDGFN